MATERLILDRIPTPFTLLHVFIFSSTLVVYNAHYLLKRSREEVSDRFAWSQHYKLWHFLFLAAGSIGCVWSLFHLNNDILVACGVLGVLSFAYSLPMLPFASKKSLREFGWVKIIILTAVWTIVTSVLPMLYHQVSLNAYPFEILLRFVFLFTLCVAFDIRDMQTDLEAGISTLPNLIGIKNSYRLMDIALVLFATLSVVQYFRYPSAVRLGGELVAAVVTRLVIQYSKYHPSDRVYLGLVDGMMLLYAMLVLMH
jgi:4-hydroxybenzoate polyprenyltransferase